MDNVEKLLKTTVEELEKLLNARNVMGDPIDRGETTIIPMVSYGFGFGAGGGDEKKGSGTGAGGGIKPLGAIIIDASGARVEGVQSAASNLATIIGRTAERVFERASANRTERANESNDNTAEAGPKTGA